MRGFCLACVTAGFDVEVLCPEPAVGSGVISDPGIQVRRLGYCRPRRAQFLSALPGAPETLAASPFSWVPAGAYGARLTAEVLRRQGRYRALVSHWLLPCTVAGALGTAVPHLGVVHGSDMHLLARLSGGRAVARWLVRGGVRLAFVSRDLYARFAQLLPSSLWDRFESLASVQPMGVDWASISGVDRRGARQRLEVSGPVALWMGRMVPVKRPDLALAVAERWPELTLLIAGSGPLESRLRRRAEGLGRRVRFLGWADEQTRAMLLGAADALLITSTELPDGRSEGLPVAALEALAVGLPVVASRVGGLGELEAYGSGAHLVGGDSADAICAALRKVVDKGAAGARSGGVMGLDWQVVLPRLLAPLGLT